MATITRTITSAGEILTSTTAISDDQREENLNPVSPRSTKQYVQCNQHGNNRTVIIPNALRSKLDIDGIPFESDDSDCTLSDDSENDDEGFEVSRPISPPPAQRVQKDPANNEGMNTIRPASRPPIQRVQRNSSANEMLGSTRQSQLKPVNESKPVNLNDLKINQTLDSKESHHSKQSEGSSSKKRDSSLKKERPSVMNDSSKGRISMMSEATPIQFHEPGDDQSISLHSKRSDDISEATPQNFYESTVAFDFDLDGSDSGSNATPTKLGQSRREWGMTMAERKASQRIESKVLDKCIEEDAERDIVNVYLETSAFADKERINLTEDIYSFVLACSSRSLEFWTAIYFILVKYLCYGVIFVNLTRMEYTGEGREPAVLATKFIMIPVAVSMQEDLITVYYNVANKKYDAFTIKGNTHATEIKWILSNLLRAIDGLLSLAVNFGVMLLEIDLLNIFLSFAALDFLQYIDDVIYELAEKGFFGQKLEQATIKCKIITFTRRTQSADPCNNFITNLDTILLLLSMAVCYVIYIFFLATFYSDEDNTLFGLDELNEMP